MLSRNHPALPKSSCCWAPSTSGVVRLALVTERVDENTTSPRGKPEIGSVSAGFGTASATTVLLARPPRAADAAETSIPAIRLADVTLKMNSVAPFVNVITKLPVVNESALAPLAQSVISVATRRPDNRRPSWHLICILLCLRPQTARIGSHSTPHPRPPSSGVRPH